MVNEKISRAQLSSGDRHPARGDKDQARAFYQVAIDTRSADPGTAAAAAAAELSNRAVTALAKDRTAPITSLQKILSVWQFRMTRPVDESHTLRSALWLIASLLAQRAAHWRAMYAAWSGIVSTQRRTRSSTSCR